MQMVCVAGGRTDVEKEETPVGEPYVQHTTMGAYALTIVDCGSSPPECSPAGRLSGSPGLAGQYPTSYGVNEQHERSPGHPYQRRGRNSGPKAFGPILSMT